MRSLMVVCILAFSQTACPQPDDTSKHQEERPRHRRCSRHWAFTDAGNAWCDVSFCRATSGRAGECIRLMTSTLQGMRNSTLRRSAPESVRRRSGTTSPATEWGVCCGQWCGRLERSAKLAGLARADSGATRCAHGGLDALLMSLGDDLLSEQVTISVHAIQLVIGSPSISPQGVRISLSFPTSCCNCLDFQPSTRQEWGRPHAHSSDRAIVLGERHRPSDGLFASESDCLSVSTVDQKPTHLFGDTGGAAQLAIHERTV